MEWMTSSLLGNIANSLDNTATEKSISGLKMNQQQTTQDLFNRDRQVDKLKVEVERQKLAIQALTRFLIEKQLINEQELQDFIQQVDSEDGMIDGKISSGTSGQPRFVFPESNSE